VVEVSGDDFDDLAGYEVAIEVTGGTSGTLDLEEMSVDEEDADFVFDELEIYTGFNPSVPRLMCATTDEGVSSSTPKYLATFVFRASSNADGLFTVSAVEGDGVTGTLAIDSSSEALSVNLGSSASVRVQELETE